VFRIGDKVTQLRNNYDKGAAGIFIRGDLIHGARLRYGAVAGEVAVERAVRGELEAGRGAQGGQMLVVIGGGVQVAALGSEPLAYLAKADKAIGRPVQRVGDHGVDSRYRGAFLVGDSSMQPSGHDRRTH
jgi:hypothetical protein